MLELKELSKTFGGNAAVKGVTCSFVDGRISGLIGPNGAGKTTVFNLITGLIKPSGGQVFFEGKEITGQAPHQVARLGIGRGFQRTRLFYALSAAENVMIALPEVSHNIFQALTRLGAGKRELVEKAHHYLGIIGV